MIINITQTTILAYLTVVLSTIEKEFGLKSKEAAWVYSGNEIAQICFIVFLPFVGRVKRRPLYIGVAAIISAIGMFLIAVPYFAGRSKRFGKGKHKDIKYTYFSENRIIVVILKETWGNILYYFCPRISRKSRTIRRIMQR